MRLKLILTIIFLLLLSLPAFAKKKIAVLPFDVLSNNEELQYFGVGTMDTINTALSSIEDFMMIDRGQLNVVMKEQSFQKSGFTDEKSSVELGKLLGAEILVLGSIQEFKGKYRLSVKLTEVKTGKILQAKQVTGDDIFELQDTLANEIVNSQKINLNQSQKDRISNITNSTKSISAYEYYIKGKTNYYLYTIKGFQKAVANFDKALEIDNNYTLALASKAETQAFYATQLKLSNQPYKELLKEAEENANKSLNNNIKLAEAHRAMSVVHMFNQRTEESKEEINKALKINPNDPESNIILWILSPKKKKFEVIEKEIDLLDPDSPIIKKVIETNPYSVIAYGYLGLAYYFDDQLEKAIEYSNKAIELSPNYDFSYYVLGLTYVKKLELDKALDIYYKAKEMNPDYSLYSLGLGTIYLAKKDYENALKEFLIVLKSEPLESYSLFNISIIYYKKGNYEESYKYFNKAIEALPDYGELSYTQYYMAKILLKTGKDKEAIEKFKLASKLSPKLDLPYIEMGEYYFNKGENNIALENALKAYEISKSKDSKKLLVDIYLKKGIEFYNNKDYTKSLEEYNKALKINNEDSRIYNNIGSNYFIQGKYQSALESYKKAIEIDPLFANSYVNMGYIYETLGKKDEAEKSFQRACDSGSEEFCTMEKK